MASFDGSTAQRIARYAFIAALLGLGAWMLRGFIPALCWAVVLAIATSSLYERWRSRFRGAHRDLWAAATFTTIVAVVLLVPLVYGAVLAVHEALALSRSFLESARNGPPELPRWLQNLPGAGDWIQALWVDAFGRADAANSALTQARPEALEWTRAVGSQLARRAVTLAFTLIALFFVYANRDQLQSDVPRVSRRLFGPTVERLLNRAVEAIRAAVDGIVLVAVAEGAIMCAVYAAAGAPHPILFGAITGIFAMVPFAAPLVFGVIAVLRLVDGAVGAAIGILVAGTIVLFVADHFVRPVIIGGAARLPFLWVLLGILGGIESFGLIGIFLGPALMAALVSVWRSWVRELPAAEERSP
ncbi:MAG TPA: AI-2E family transporter [Steroidobacteraceae bacterium]|nr:AI-2E family transporter [Steroidobacteraceae bacterium]